MRIISFNTITLFTLVSTAFLSGYYFHDKSLAQSGSFRNTTKASKPIAVSEHQPAKLLTSNALKHPKPAPLTQSNQAAITQSVVNQLTQAASETSVSEVEDTRSATDLFASIEGQAAQHLSHEEIRSHPEFDLLVSRLKSDPAARAQLLQQFMKVSGSPLGRTLSQLLTMASVGTDSPELKAAAVGLLRDGSTEQRLNALELLGSMAGNDQTTRSTVLEVLRKDANANPQLAMAAMASLNHQGVTSQSEHQEVLKTVQPFTANPDPQVRYTSLQMLSLWAGRDQATLQTFTEATRDADANVRTLAVSALGQGGFSYDQVRDTLLTALQNPNEDPGVKVTAQQVLEGFPLDEQALQIYQAHLSSSNFQQPGTQATFN